MYSPFLETISFGRESTSALALSESKEWLVTNGMGSYASGTVSGILTRRYHGLLVASLKPPLERTLLASKIDEEIIYDGVEYALSANRWASQQVSLEGYRNIEAFYLDRGIPVWNFACADALMEKRIWMEDKSNTTYVHYKVLRSTLPIKIFLKAYVNYRGYHSLTKANGWRMALSPLKNGLKIQPFQEAVPFYLLSNEGSPALTNEWHHGFYLSIEAYRWLDCVEDHLLAGNFQATLKEGECLTLVISTDQSPDLNGEKALERRMAAQENLLQHSHVNHTGAPGWIQQLILAADQFIVERPHANGPNGKTIIAGYHWFTDWGRDTMISLPGLTLTTGRASIAKEILLTFSQYVDQGMLPNRFLDTNGKPEYNTVDAALWFFESLKSYYQATQDQALIQELFPVLVEIIEWYQKGTRYSIHVDPQDGLLYAGEAGVQLTWMDAKIGDWVATPRIGKAIEVNALWIQALRTMSAFATLLGQSSQLYDQAATRAIKNISRFWNEENSCCFDVIDGLTGNDSSVRPNQLLAISVGQSLLSPEQEKLIVDLCERLLLTSHGLRSLSPHDPHYKGHYVGSPFDRDAAYHQGTVWAWLLGPFCQAHYKVYRDKQAILQFLKPLSFHLAASGLGSCSEIFDGDSPMDPKGCIAQAWSVAQILQTWQLINA